MSITTSAFKLAFTGANNWAKIGVGVGSKVAGWALKHPHQAMVAAGALYGGYLLSQTGPGQRPSDKAYAGKLAMAYDMPSTGFDIGEGSTRNALMSSTDGLVQGLHRGRHHG